MTTRPLAYASCMFVLCLATVSCSHQDSNAPTRIRIAGGPPADTFSVVANALASLYSQRVPNVSSEARQTTGTTENIDAVENGDAECGLGSADLVYNARLRGTSGMAQPHTHLRGVAVLFPNAVHLTTRANSGVATLADLAGKRIAAAVPGDVSARGRGFRMEAVASSIADLSVRHTRPTTVVLRIDDAVSQLGRGEIDAAHFYGGYPFRPVTEAAQRYGIHLVEFDDLASSLVKAKYPFSKPIVIPADTYPGQSGPVRTIAIDNVLVCRDELTADLVYKLTRSLYEGLASIASVHEALRQINPENGAATPIPLHDGATRYYRERDLFR